MAKPETVQRLQHGKILAGKVFRTFVETWNWLVAGWENLKGDHDVDVEHGIIYIDRADDEHPVIRINRERLSAAQSADLAQILKAGENITITQSSDGKTLTIAATDGSGAGVESLNTLTGQLELLGGPKIRIIKDADAGTIKIDFDESKDESDTPSTTPGDPCAHPGNPGKQDHGGVSEEFSSPTGTSGAIPAGTGGEEGIVADSDVHHGDNNCNCN